MGPLLVALQAYPSAVGLVDLLQLHWSHLQAQRHALAHNPQLGKATTVLHMQQFFSGAQKGYEIRPKSEMSNE